MLGGAADFTVDAKGNLVSDAFTIPRPVFLDGNLEQHQTGPWMMLPGRRVGFFVDDSTLSSSAYPYVIDPTTLFDGGTSRGAAHATSDGSDDGMITATGSIYPPDGLAPPAEVDDFSTYMAIQRSSEGAGSYTTSNGFLRWDTSALPDTARIESAELVVSTGNPLAGLAALGNYAPCIDKDANSRALVGSWFNWNPPLSPADYSSDAGADAFAGVYLSTINPDVPTPLSINIANTDGITTDNSGPTALRLSIDGDQPTGQNSLCLATNEDGTLPGPQLVINYVIPPIIDKVTVYWDPANAGDGVIWSVDWSDAAQSQVKALICRGSLPPPVGGQCWNPATNTWTDGANSPGMGFHGPSSHDTLWHGWSSAWYPTTQDDVGTHNYYAYACDESGVCSREKSGTFQVVNVPPRVTSVEVTPNPASPGETMTFRIHWTDTVRDAVGVALCRTPGFDISTWDCEGGEADRIGTGPDGSPHGPNTTSTGGDDVSTIVYTPGNQDGGNRYFYAYVWDSRQEVDEYTGIYAVAQPLDPVPLGNSDPTPPFSCTGDYAKPLNSVGKDTGQIGNQTGIKANTLFGVWDSAGTGTADCIRVSSVNVVDISGDSWVELGWFLGWDTRSAYNGAFKCDDGPYYTTPQTFVTWRIPGGAYMCKLDRSAATRNSNPCPDDGSKQCPTFRFLRVEDSDLDTIFHYYQSGIDLGTVNQAFSRGKDWTNGERHAPYDTASAHFKALQKNVAGDGSQLYDFCCSVVATASDDPGFHWQKVGGSDTETEVLKN
ncbi:MAG: hypothetical protein ABR600_07305 [Actinomycetota bacterium]